MGVVVATLDAEGVRELTGTIPQNVNFAVKASILQAFLDANAVPYQVGFTGGDAEYVPEEVAQGAASYSVRVDCYEFE